MTVGQGKPHVSSWAQVELSCPFTVKERKHDNNIKGAASEAIVIIVASVDMCFKITNVPSKNRKK